ncbi:MAG: D-Ala-D-Ala carboxypeptidase family metallohydrolase [Minicystis sp.]
MSLNEKQLRSAQDYNQKVSAKQWSAASLPDDALRSLAVESPEFSQRVALIQVEEELYEDGKLGPRTMQALIERRVALEVEQESASLDLGWWKAGDPYPEASVIIEAPAPLAAESLDAYLDRLGCGHFSAFELTRLARWARNIEPLREDWPRIIPTLRLAEILRHELGGDPLLVLSGYRPRRYNKQIGGAKQSQHMLFRALLLGLDGDSAGSDDQQRQLYEVAARLFSRYGQELSMGLGFYAPKRGTQISIDTGFKLRTWNADHVQSVLRDLSLPMPVVAPTASTASTAPEAPRPAPTDGGVPYAVFQAARAYKLGAFTRADAGAGSRFYVFEKGTVHYNAFEQRVLEVKLS